MTDKKTILAEAETVFASWKWELLEAEMNGYDRAAFRDLLNAYKQMYLFIDSPPTTPVQGYREEECDWCGTDTMCLEIIKADGMPKDICVKCLIEGKHVQALSQTDIQPSGWIPVSVTPSEGFYVIKSRFNIGFGTWMQGVWHTSGLEIDEEDITHYFPLPHPPGINSTEDQPGPKRHSTKRYAIKLGDEYLRERFGDDCFTDDLGHAFLFFYKRLAEDWRRGDERIVEIVVDEEGGLYDSSTEEEETDA